MNWKAVVEGLLFVSGDEGLSIDEICNIINKDKNLLEDLVVLATLHHKKCKVAFLIQIT